MLVAAALNATGKPLTLLRFKVCGELPAPAAVTVTFSVYVPGASVARTDWLIPRATEPGELPELGVTVRKFAPPVTGVAATVKAIGVPELVTWKFCAGICVLLFN